VKNVLLIWNALLTIVLGIVAYRQFTPAASNSAQAITSKADSSAQVVNGPIYYVNTDSLSQNYLFAKELDTQLKQKKAQYESRFQDKVKKFEKEVLDFQENARWMSKEEGERRQQELMAKEQELAKLEQDLTKGLFDDQEKLTADLRKRILDYIEQVKAEENVAFILGYSAAENTILLANDSLDITSEVLDGLNTAYQKQSATKE
jgi:outer membrane protein